MLLEQPSSQQPVAKPKPRALNPSAPHTSSTTAKSLTPNNIGVNNIVDVGGMSTLAESLKAVCVEGVVTVTGVLGDEAEEKPDIMDCLWHVFSVRGIFLGTRRQFKDMIAFVEEKNIEPVIDEKIFDMAEIKEAYRFLEAQKHFSKVVVRIGEV
jgi:D-arabinose 1-dehydrogenase-like Zn-dependent alcohol dehydrogenase